MPKRIRSEAEAEWNREYMRRRRLDPDFVELSLKRAREYRATPAAKAKRRERENDPVKKQLLREQQKQWLSRPENRERAREVIRKRRSDPLKRAAELEAQRNRRNDPSNVENVRKIGREYQSKRRNDPIIGQKIRDHAREAGFQYRNDPANKARIQENGRKYRSRPEFKKQRQEYDNKWLNNPANKEKLRDIVRTQKHRRRARLANVENTFTRKDWQTLLSYSKHCHWCKTPFTAKLRPTHDHVIPLAKGGANTLTNSCCACRPCNSKKHAWVHNPITGQLLLI